MEAALELDGLVYVGVVPSIAAGTRSPCQWIAVGSARRLVRRASPFRA